MEFNFNTEKLQEIAGIMKLTDTAVISDLERRLGKMYHNIKIIEHLRNSAGNREIQIEKHIRLQNALSHAAEYANDPNPYFQRTLSITLPDIIAKMVTNQTLQAIIPEAQHVLTPPPPERRHPSREPYDADNYMLERRRNIIADNAGFILHQLLKTLQAPLDEALHLEKESENSKGGNPGNPARKYLINNFLPIYEYITKTAATYAHTGKFVTIIGIICEAFGIEQTGLSDAIRYQIAKREKPLRNKVRKKPELS